MQGTPIDGGVVTRAIDVIFNSLDAQLPKMKYMIEPADYNDFQIQSIDVATKKQRDALKEPRYRNAYSTRK